MAKNKLTIPEIHKSALSAKKAIERIQLFAKLVQKSNDKK
jgi:hypothetical protein